MEWMARDLNTVKVELKDSYNYLMTTVIRNKQPHLSSNLDTVTFKLSTVRPLLTISTLYEDKFIEIIVNL